MDKCTPLLFVLAFLLLCRALVRAEGELSLPAAATGEDDDRRRVQIYIIHVQKPENLVFGSRREREEWHESFLPSLTLESGEPRLVYSYVHAIGGFAARLTPEEVEAMEARDGFLFAERDAELKTRTTYSPTFLGVTRSGQLWDMANRGEGKIVGVLEQGFYSNPESFRDDGMAAPPSRWTGTCDYQPIHCNRKLIGNRIFNASGAYNTKKDYNHGTHVASTAAGNAVKGANFNGEAWGSASGAAPRAHLAFYSVRGYSDALKAVDQAIEDGVDVLSVSYGLTTAPPFHKNSFDIATLSAIKEGVFVSVAAGNDGPKPKSMLDNTPWTLSVGASSTDRVIRVQIRLGNGDVVQGETTNSAMEFFPVGALLPAVTPGGRMGNLNLSYCKDIDYDVVDVAGKVVVCILGGLRTSSAHHATPNCTVNIGGAKALIALNEKKSGSTIQYFYTCNFPTLRVNFEEAQQLKTYMATDPHPRVSFEPRGTITGVLRHPAVAGFSARGPSRVNNGVLKPDVLGPGVNILAAWDSSSFYFASGTSMACPHLSGIAALLLNLHPSWSPAMIKSAIMTTSYWQDNTGMPISDETGNPASLFATGAGHVNASRAADPGLVYDIRYSDYVKYVCGLGYTRKQVNTLLREVVDCSAIGGISGEELNYPSFSIEASSNPKIVSRTVTNVGRARELYTLSLDTPQDVWIDVFPRRLDFSKLRQKHTYTVKVVSTNPWRSPGELVEGQLTWVSAHHTVRSPIAITFA